MATARAKNVLVNYGFRLPSARDNRPLTFEEFENRVNQVIYVSATPGPYELTKSAGALSSRSFGLPAWSTPKSRSGRSRARWTTCSTKSASARSKTSACWSPPSPSACRRIWRNTIPRSACKCAYLHSEVSTLDRIKILRDLRRGEFDALIGVNLLREGLDLPEVSLVAILDADKEGFLRSAGSLIQTIGRAARNLNGSAILYADVVTDSMRRAMDETNRRRKIQEQYNEVNHITPQSIIKPIDMSLVAIAEGDYVTYRSNRKIR